MLKAEKQIVLARLQTMPPNLRLCLGHFCGGRDEMIEEVTGESTLGEEIVELYMFGLRSFKDFPPHTHQTHQAPEGQ